MGRRRQFGTIRRLPSGRWQVRLQGGVTQFVAVPGTFARRREAEAWVAAVQADLARGEWVDVEAGRTPFGSYATPWLEQHPQLSERTRERYESVLRLQLLPVFGPLGLSSISEAEVRRWRHDRLQTGVGPPTVAKAYRLLRAILNTAVDDGAIRRNPCRIRGASADAAAERPVLTVEQVFAVAERMPERLRALVLLATFAGLRFGELVGLRRGDLDLDAGWVRVRRSVAEMADGRLVVKEPKTAAGRRTVALPAAILPALREHVDRFAESGVDGVVFVGPQGGWLRRQNVRKAWLRARESAGVPPVTFHDLRHTGNTLAASTGASLRELMARMGHASTRAALIYQHATDERDRVIADALSTRIEASGQARGQLQARGRHETAGRGSAGSGATD
jgi:integrase